MGCGVYLHGKNVLTEKLETFGKWGIPPTDPGYQGLWGKLQGWLAAIGGKLPRISVAVKVTFGHSPGIFTLSVDPEIGWVVEARDYKDSPRIYKSVSDDIAKAIMKDELTPELEKYILTPDPYIGE